MVKEMVVLLAPLEAVLVRLGHTKTVWITRGMDTYEIKVVNHHENSESVIHAERLDRGIWVEDMSIESQLKPKPKARETCDFCNKPLPGPNRPDLLADDGWTPSYWIPTIEPDIEESEHHFPVCGECSDKFLEFDTENGDMQVKLEYLPMVLCRNTKWSLKDIVKAVSINRERYHGSFVFHVM